MCVPWHGCTHTCTYTHSKQINVKTKIFEGFKKLNKITQRNEEKKGRVGGRGGTEGGRKEEKWVEGPLLLRMRTRFCDGSHGACGEFSTSQTIWANILSEKHGKHEKDERGEDWDSNENRDTANEKFMRGHLFESLQ